MGWQNLKDETKKLFNSNTFFKSSFHLFTLTILSLLLPLSFLFLARLSYYNYLSTVTSDPFSLPSSFIFWLFEYTNPAILYSLISVLSIATLIHGLTGKITLLCESPDEIYRPKLYISWIFLCTLQICVGFGIEGTIASGIEGFTTDIGRRLSSRIVFFLGLHETMLYWSRAIVKPVVDDTVFGEDRGEKWVQRVVAGASFGGFWWWKLRDEVESLVLAAESKRELRMVLSLDDFVTWWLYYVTVTIGMTRIVKGLLWVWIVLVSNRRGPVDMHGSSNDLPVNEDKV